MRVAIIGAGFTGLSAGYYLAKNSADVTIFEIDTKAGGLAAGYKKESWNWPLEKHYHHLFTSDYEILSLAENIGHKINFSRPKTSMLVNNQIFQLDSPINLLKFPYLTLPDRVRTGIVLTYLRATPFWKPLENTTAKYFLEKYMGENSWKIFWQPLFEGKFGELSDKIPASWFWARIKKRSASLGYPRGGFESLANSIAKKLSKIHFETQVLNIKRVNNNFEIIYKNIKTGLTKKGIFDKVISTLPFPLFLKIFPDYPSKKSLESLPQIGAINLILRLNKHFLKDDTYWLNVNEKDFPFLAVVEHTNLINKKYYNNENLIYVGKYLPQTHKYFSMTDKDLLKAYDPYLKKLNSQYLKHLIGFDVFKSPFSQPIIPLNYSKIIPPIETPVVGLYLATIQQVYPWDRGTNYAVELGRKVADLL